MEQSETNVDEFEMFYTPFAETVKKTIRTNLCEDDMFGIRVAEDISQSVPSFTRSPRTTVPMTHSVNLPRRQTDSVAHGLYQ